MYTSTLSLYAHATQKNMQPEKNNESFSEQIVNLNKTIREEYIKLSEQSSSRLSPLKRSEQNSPQKSTTPSKGTEKK